MWVVNGIVRQVESDTTLLREPEEFQLRGHKELLVLPADPDIEKIVSWPADRLTGNGSICLPMRTCILMAACHGRRLVGALGARLHKKLQQTASAIGDTIIENSSFFLYLFVQRQSKDHFIYRHAFYLFSLGGPDCMARNHRKRHRRPSIADIRPQGCDAGDLYIGQVRGWRGH